MDTQNSDDVADSDSGDSEPSPYDPARQTTSESSSNRRPKNRLLRATVAVFIGVLLGALAQFAGPSTDHQNANIVSVVVGAITVLYVLFQIHGLAKNAKKPWLIPAGVLLVMVAMPVLFRLEGFSGEMLPQFEFRFSSDRPAMRSVGDAAAANSSTVSEDSNVTESQTNGPHHALANSLGFLGSDRTGMISKRLFAIPTDASQVETLWSQGVGEGWSSFAVSGDRAVTLEQREGLECLTCYRLNDGELLWIVSHEARHEHALGGAGPRSTPTIDGDRVYAQGATGRVWCVDLASGKTHWTVDLLDLAGWDQLTSEAAITWGRSGSPLVIDHDLCVIPFGGPEPNAETGRSLVALDAKTGDTRWVAGEDQISFASPALINLSGVRQIVSVNEKTISGHRIEDGKVLWEVEWFGQSNAGANCSMVIQADKDRFLIGKGYGGGSALFRVTLQPDPDSNAGADVKPDADDSGTWQVDSEWVSMRVLKTKFTHAIVDGNIAYAISNGSLEAVAIDEGMRQWTQRRNVRFGQGQIMLVEKTIVAQAESGDVVFVLADPTEYRELLRLPALTSKTWNIPTIAGRHLLVRNDRQVFCFLLPPRSDTDSGR